MKQEEKKQISIIFKLKNVMQEKGYTRAKLCKLSGLRFETVQAFYMGTIIRVDLYVLTQLCKVLKCNTQDIIEYIEDK